MQATPTKPTPTKLRTILSPGCFVALGYLIFAPGISFAQELPDCAKTPYTSAGTITCKVPAGVSKITAQVWGAGGAGGTGSAVGGSNRGGGGGGGGGFTAGSLDVPATGILTLVVGAGGASSAGSGEESSVTADEETLSAPGGAGGTNASGGTAGTGGAGGAGSSFSGGTGANGATNAGGGGGSSAGTEAGGNPGTGSSGGTAVTGGGAGGNGSSGAGTGTAGGSPGGGGGGGNGAGQAGGAGAPGQVALSWKLDQTIGNIIFTPASLVVEGTTEVSATATSGLAVVFSSTTQEVCTVSGITVTGVTAGTCTIAADQGGNDDYEAAGQVTQDIEVGKGTQTIGAVTFTPASLVVEGTTEVSATATSGLAVVFSSTTQEVCTVSGITVTGVTAGTCTIAADQEGTDNYNAAPQVTQDITVGKGEQAALLAVANPPTIFLNDTSTLSTTGGSGEGEVSYAVTDGDEVCSVSDSTLTGIVIGSCTVTATKGEDANYKEATATVDVTVTARPGDLDGDGVIDESDVTDWVAKFLLAGEDDKEFLDINGDGNLDILDLKAVIILILEATQTEND